MKESTYRDTMRIFPHNLRIAQEDDMLADVMRDMFPPPKEKFPFSRERRQFRFSPPVLRQWLAARGVAMESWKQEDANTFVIKSSPLIPNAETSNRLVKIKKEMEIMDFVRGVFWDWTNSTVSIRLMATPWIIDGQDVPEMK